MKRYHVRVGMSHAMVEVDGGIFEALNLFEQKIHRIQEPVDVEVQQIITHIREQPVSTITTVTRRDA